MNVTKRFKLFLHKNSLQQIFGKIMLIEMGMQQIFLYDGTLNS